MSKIAQIRMPCGRCAPSAPCSPRDVRYPFALTVQLRHFRVVTPNREARSEALYRSEEHTSELESLMRTSYPVFRLKKKTGPSPPPQYRAYRRGFCPSHLSNRLIIVHTSF